MDDERTGIGSSIVTEDRCSSSMVMGSSENEYENNSNLNVNNSELNMLIEEKKCVTMLMTAAIINQGASMDQPVNLLAQQKDGSSQKSNEIPNISNENYKSDTTMAQDFGFQTIMKLGSSKANGKVSAHNNNLSPSITLITYANGASWNLGIVLTLVQNRGQTPQPFTAKVGIALDLDEHIYTYTYETD